MSEFSKASKQYEELRSFVDLEIASFSAKTNEVEQQLEILGSSLIPRVEKLEQKTYEIDPITAKPRYGAKHIEKVKLLAGNAQTLQGALETILSNSKSREGDEDAQGQEEKECEEMVVEVDNDASQAGIFSLNSTFTYNQRLVDTETTLMQAKEGLQSGTLDLLKDEKYQLRELTVFINGVNEPFDQVVQRCQDNLGPLSESFLNARDFLTNVITSICSHPEDQNLRRIRATHPVVFKNLTCIEGGLEALLSMGFKVTVESSTTEQTDEALQFIKQYENKEVDLFLNGSVASGKRSVTLDLVAYLLILSQKVAQDVFFVMEEPSIEDTTKWAEWWDGLVATRAICDNL